VRPLFLLCRTRSSSACICCRDNARRWSLRHSRDFKVIQDHRIGVS